MLCFCIVVYISIIIQIKLISILHSGSLSQLWVQLVLTDKDTFSHYGRINYMVLS